MDLVDLAKIVLRRWYVALAILLVGAVAALLLAGSIAPKYKVTAQSILISGQAAQDTPGSEGPVNPYLAFSGSLFTTLSAVTRTVDGQEFRDRLDADGNERDFLFTTSQEAPVIITESTASTPEEALELSQSVQDALAETLVTLQSAEDVPIDQQIRIRVLTTSTPVQEVGDRNRVIVGLMGVTIAAAVGGAVLVESISSTRRRTRAARAPSGDGDGDQVESDDPTADGMADGDPDAPTASPRSGGDGDLDEDAEAAVGRSENLVGSGGTDAARG